MTRCAAAPSARRRGPWKAESIRVEANRDNAERLALIVPGT